jgi:putative mRNA 3-end processing factor
MNPYRIDVLGSGAVILGDDVVCDGFHKDRRVRAQTHVHLDHMGDFETSKGFQDLLMSEATRDLLVAEFNADLSVRENLYALRPGSVFSVNGSKVSLIPNGHMLGSVQVLVEKSNGVRIGYSGDFRWPLDDGDIISCDALVVDSTYGSPQSVREYTQEEAETSFLQLVHDKIKRGSLAIRAHRGTIHRAVGLLGAHIDTPIVCSQRLCREIDVYQRYGSAIGTVIQEKSTDAKAALASGRYIRLYSKGDYIPVEPREGVSIVLSAFMTRPRDPVLEYSERAYRVALSNHADFNGTVEYVKATGAKFVVTDNTRTHGVELAFELSRRLGVTAIPSSNEHHLEWGQG